MPHDARPDEELVTAFMRELAGTPPAAASGLPSPEVLWWKGQLLRRWDAERKAVAPLDVMEPVQIIAGLATAALLLLWALPSLVRALPL